MMFHVKHKHSLNIKFQLAIVSRETFQFVNQRDRKIKLEFDAWKLPTQGGDVVFKEL